MKAKIIFCLIFYSTISAAQNWCPPGANWYYRYSDMTAGGYIHYNYDKDTMINQINCKKINGILYQSEYGNNYRLDTLLWQPVFSYFSNDTVYFLQDTLFKPYFYFNAHLGDTLLIAEHFAIVDSNGVISLNNHSLRYYYFHFLDSCFTNYHSLDDKVIEGIGICTNNFLPYWACAIDAPAFDLRCYDDNSFGHYSVDSTRNCDYIYTGLAGLKSAALAECYPNPANDYCTIQLQGLADSYTAQFVDITGRVILSTKITNSTKQIPILNLPAGLYFVKISDGSQQVGVAKLIKQ